MADARPWTGARFLAADDERALVRAARNDPDAFGELCRRYAPDLYRYLRLRVGNDEDAADLTQQVFVRALAALPRYRERGAPFGAWLFRIARNLVTDAYRRQRPAVSWDGMAEALHCPEADNPEIAALRREEASRLQTAVRHLRDDERELIALRFVAGLTLAEIAAVIGTSRSSVDRRIARILQSLKEYYHDH
ncbi:MAG TPA: sigma-70 family RNA polymerase sigma factor [Chloroflexota bacterium]|nr:sigma-70 family RNA polymerase sigma factor [Chloroflexota bacterium]